MHDFPENVSSEFRTFSGAVLYTLTERPRARREPGGNLIKISQYEPLSPCAEGTFALYCGKSDEDREASNSEKKLIKSF